VWCGSPDAYYSFATASGAFILVTSKQVYFDVQLVVMKTLVLALRPSCAALMVFFAVSTASAGNILDFLFPPSDLQAITVTDFTSEGSLRRLPTPEKPVYYTAISAGYRDFGGIKAGEKPIARQVVDQTMLKILAKQGYLPAREGQRPDILLAWTWGTLNVERSPIISGYSARLNERQMLRFLGGAKLGLVSQHRSDPFPEQTLLPGLLDCSAEGRNLSDVAADDLYVAAVAAYAVELTESKHAVLLWNTRISCPSRGFWLPEALPAMLAIGGPFIGRETSKPVWIRASDKFRPDIKLGDPKLIEYLEHQQSTVVKVGPSS
jgi:hypothetical protein